MKPKKQKLKYSQACYNENHSSGVIKTAPAILYSINSITLGAISDGNYYLQIFNLPYLPKEGTVPDVSFKIKVQQNEPILFYVWANIKDKKPIPLFNFHKAMSWCISSEPHKKKITNPIFETLSFLYV